jgi:hypothetical protein
MTNIRSISRIIIALFLLFHLTACTEQVKQAASSGMNSSIPIPGKKAVIGVPYTETDEDNHLPFFGEITEIRPDKEPIQVDVDSFAIFSNVNEMVKAAVKDGECTQEEADRHRCLSEPFYLHLTGEKTTYTLSPETKIIFTARDSKCDFVMDDSGGNLFSVRITPVQWISYYRTCFAFPDVYHFSAKDGQITALSEFTLP